MGKRDIGYAVELLKQGQRVRRPQWGEGFYVQATNVNMHTYDDATVTMHPVSLLMMHMPSLNRLQPFTCHHDDLLATDWELAL